MLLQVPKYLVGVASAMKFAYEDLGDDQFEDLVSGHLGLGLMEMELWASYQIRDGGAGCM